MFSLRAHNLLDYFLAAVFFTAPEVFGFSHVVFADDVFRVIGVAILGYSLLTDYRYSIARVMPMSMHRTFDLVCGVFVATAPWIYNYREDLSNAQLVLHGILAMMMFGFVVFSRSHDEQVSAVERPMLPGRPLPEQKLPDKKAA